MYFYHRRNCIVCNDLLIKVSDQAMYCSKYDGEYYMDECYAKIPLRWMAWEAVLSVILWNFFISLILGIIRIKSDLHHFELFYTAYICHICVRPFIAL